MQTNNVFNSKEYIERDAAIAFMNEVEPCICHNQDGAVFAATKDSDMLKFLRAIPAADVVPVVRCKECADKFEWPWCGMFPDDGYCSAGARMDGDA